MKNKWEKPKLKKLGNAKQLTKNINDLGPGDSQFSLLAPS